MDYLAALFKNRTVHEMQVISILKWPFRGLFNFCNDKRKTQKYNWILILKNIFTSKWNMHLLLPTSIGRLIGEQLYPHYYFLFSNEHQGDETPKQI